MNAEIEPTNWEQAGQMLEEMDRAGEKVKLMRTAALKSEFTWAFTTISKTAPKGSKEIYTYGRTPGEAIERGHAGWLKRLESYEE